MTVVIGPDGKMTEEAGEDFAGLDRMEAREAVVEELTEQGLLLKVEDYVHNVGYSQRSHVPIEPYLSEQWFLKYPQVGAAAKAVEEGRIKFYPERWSKTYAHWMAEPQRLVHQPPALVGAPGAGLVPARESRERMPWRRSWQPGLHPPHRQLWPERDANSDGP